MSNLPQSPKPHVVVESGDAQDAPKGSYPIALYGAGGGGPIAIGDVTGLQDIIDNLTQRVEALE